MNLELFEKPRSFTRADAHSTGDAGEMLVCVHMAARGIECGIVKGRHIDVVLFVEGRPLKVQVKASMVERSFGGADNIVDGRGNPARGLLSYKPHVDAFAFCFLPDPYPYYLITNAVSKDRITLPSHAFTRAERDRSFNELLARWVGLAAVEAALAVPP